MFERDIMVENINQIEQTKRVYQSAGAQTTQGVKAQNVTLSSSGSAKVDTVEKLTDEQIRAQIEQLLKDNDLTIEDCKTEIENFETLSLREQLEAVKKYLNLSEAVQEDVKEETVKEQKSDKFDKSEYNKKTLTEKIKQCEYELAKNIYIHGSGNIKGSKGETLKANGQEAWDKLTPEEKQAFVDELMTFINNHEDLKNTLDEIYNNAKSSDDKTKKLTEVMVDHLMNTIQASNASEQGNEAGMSIIDFLKKPELERTKLIYQSIDKNSINDNDKEYIQRQDDIIKEVEKIKNAKTGSSEKLDIDEAYEYIRCNNLDIKKILYDAYKSKSENELSPNQKDLLNQYERFIQSENGEAILKREKIANLGKLQVEYEQLKNKTNRTDAENYNLRTLEEYLKSDDAKALEEYKQCIPKPKGDYENKVAQDGKELEELLSKSEFSGSKFEALGSIKYIEKQLAGCKSREEKLKYISTFIKLNPSSSASAIYGHYLKEFPELAKSKDLVLYASANIDKVSAATAQEIETTIAENSKNGNKLEKEETGTINRTISNILKSDRCKGKEFDDHKVIHVNTTVNEMVFETAEQAEMAVNSAFDVTTTVKDTNKQRNSVDAIINGKNTTEKNGIYITENGFNLAESNQAYAVNAATDKWRETAKHVAESKDLISKYAKSAQTDIFKGTHKALNKWFDEQEAIKYSNSLSDQIKYCDKDNQLDMHKEMMTSKYSEVIEHTAGNIKDYDVSIQAEAFDSVVSTGNTAAIKTAYENLATSPYVVQEDANLGGIVETSLKISDSDELLQKIKSGEALTREEYDSLTDLQKQEYKAAYFKSLSPAKQIELVTKISDVTTKKSVFKKIAQQNPSLLKEIIEHDAGTAEFVYNMHIADDLVLSVAKRKGSSVIQFANLAKKIEKTNIEKSGKNETAENQSKNYMDSPFDALKIKDKKNNIYLA